MIWSWGGGTGGLELEGAAAIWGRKGLIAGQPGLSLFAPHHMSTCPCHQWRAVCVFFGLVCIFSVLQGCACKKHSSVTPSYYGAPKDNAGFSFKKKENHMALPAVKGSDGRCRHCEGLLKMWSIDLVQGACGRRPFRTPTTTTNPASCSQISLLRLIDVIEVQVASIY
jgi:hypothetical protein